TAGLPPARGEPDPVRCDVEEPAEDQRDREAGQAADDQPAEHARPDIECLEDQVGRLQHHEDGGGVPDADADDSPALQPAEEVHRALGGIHESRLNRLVALSYDRTRGPAVVARVERTRIRDGAHRVRDGADRSGRATYSGTNLMQWLRTVSS